MRTLPQEEGGLPITLGYGPSLSLPVTATVLVQEVWSIPKTATEEELRMTAR